MWLYFYECWRFYWQKWLKRDLRIPRANKKKHLCFTSCFRNCVRMQYFQCPVSITYIVVICNDLLVILISIRRWSSFFGNRAYVLKFAVPLKYWKIFSVFFFLLMERVSALITHYTHVKNVRNIICIIHSQNFQVFNSKFS